MNHFRGSEKILAEKENPRREKKITSAKKNLRREKKSSLQKKSSLRKNRHCKKIFSMQRFIFRSKNKNSSLRNFQKSGEFWKFFKIYLKNRNEMRFL